MIASLVAAVFGHITYSSETTQQGPGIPSLDRAPVTRSPEIWPFLARPRLSGLWPGRVHQRYLLAFLSFQGNSLLLRPEMRYLLSPSIPATERCYLIIFAQPGDNFLRESRKFVMLPQ
jgi:hypothetical protein